MSNFIQALVLISEPPGSLVYRLSLLLALQIGAAIAFRRWRRDPTAVKARLALGLGGLLGLSLVALGVELLTAASLLDPLIGLPPLDRALSALALLLLIWSFAFPEPQPRADAVTAGLALLILLALGMSWPLWARAVAAGAQFYNGALHETAWEAAKMALLLGGLGLLGARRKPGWPIGMALLTWLLAGHIIHFLFPLAGANGAGAERLAELVALPMLAAMIYGRAFLSAAGPEFAASAPAFPNYMQMSARAPQAVWRLLRMLSVVISLGLCIALFIYPQAGLFLFWGLFIPVLPLVFFIAPGLWRNICPLAALNQTPRRFGFTRDLALPNWLQEYAYVIGMGLFLLIVPARKVLFNQDGPALALLVLALLAAAFIGGVIFKGKSGWCSSLCPLLPVQRLYGQTPFFVVRNSHCDPCVGCAKNCYDFNPSVAYLADLYDNDRYYTRARRFFAGAFPGLILAFYTVPDPPAPAAAAAMYLQFALFIFISSGLFFLLESLVKAGRNRITTLYGAAALNLYYWFNFPLLAERLGGLAGLSAPAWLIWSAQAGVLTLTLIWAARTYAKEPVFVAQTTSRPVRVGSSHSLLQHRDAQAAYPEIAFAPEGPRVVVEPGRTLLEIAENNDLHIEAGCRMGLCGSDPVAILKGMENLSPASDEERSTLRRLGLAENARLACSARVHGHVSVSLKPERPKVRPAHPPLDFKYDSAIARVVIIGNGIAGVTAADYVRRGHPTCEIHIVGREKHPLYNRMAISRLIYGRSAMHGLYLLPEAWYDEHRITYWLNTQAARIDREARRVALGTGEALPYDRLILAMGSRSFVPPIRGFGLAGTFVLREADDAMQMRAFAQEQGCRRAVVVGGGLLGLEAGYALHKLGLKVSLLETAEWLLRRQLDARGAQFLREYLERLGMDVVLQARAAAIEENRRHVRQVLLEDGRRLPCDLLLACAGITPDVALAREAGLNVRQGVVVDDHMRTSAPDILAAGDAAEHRGQIYGLWPAAVEQAEVAAINAVGGDKVYKGTPPVTILKVVGVDLTSIGRIEPEGDGEMVIALEDIQAHHYRKLVISHGAIVGAILLGYPLDAPAVTAAIKRRVDVTRCLDVLRAGEWDSLGQLVAASG